MLFFQSPVRTPTASDLPQAVNERGGVAGTGRRNASGLLLLNSPVTMFSLRKAASSTHRPKHRQGPTEIAVSWRGRHGCNAAPFRILRAASALTISPPLGPMWYVAEKMFTGASIPKVSGPLPPTWRVHRFVGVTSARPKRDLSPNRTRTGAESEPETVRTGDRSSPVIPAVREPGVRGRAMLRGFPFANPALAKALNWRASVRCASVFGPKRGQAKSRCP